jgi:hypothetical protein
VHFSLHPLSTSDPDTFDFYVVIFSSIPFTLILSLFSHGQPRNSFLIYFLLPGQYLLLSLLSRHFLFIWLFSFYSQSASNENLIPQFFCPPFDRVSDQTRPNNVTISDSHTPRHRKIPTESTTKEMAVNENLRKIAEFDTIHREIHPAVRSLFQLGAVTILSAWIHEK